MKILHVIETLGRGGAEQSLVNVLPRLVDAGHSVDVAVLWPPYDLATPLADGGVRIHKLDAPHRWNIRTLRVRLRRVIDKGEFDIVHSHLFFADLYSAIARWPSRSTVGCTTFHNLGYEAYPASTLWEKIRKRLHGYAVENWMQGRFAVSEAVAAHYRKHLSLSSVGVIHNGIPANIKPDPALSRSSVLKEWGVIDQGSLVVVPSRLVPEKGHGILVTALIQLRSHGIMPTVLIIGNGPLRSELENRLKKSNLDEQVRLIPAVSQDRLFQIIQAADLFLMSSLQEGFGLAAAEAMALGTPVIATRVGGLPELIEDGTSGILVPPGDHVALATAIKDLLGNADLRDRLSDEAADRIAERFTVRKTAEAMESLYESLI